MSRFTHFIRKVFAVKILLSGKFLLFLTLESFNFAFEFLFDWLLQVCFQVLIRIQFIAMLCQRIGFNLLPEGCIEKAEYYWFICILCILFVHVKPWDEMTIALLLLAESNWQNYVGQGPWSAACLPRAPTYQTSSLQIFSVFFITLSLSTSSPDSGMLAFCKFRMKIKF